MERVYDKRYECLSREEVHDLQKKRLAALLAKVRHDNAFYRERWDRAGTDLEKIKSLADFTERVPTTEKSDFFADQQDDPPFGRRHAHALSLGEPLITSTTSGTSGQGVEVHAQTEAEFRQTADLYGYGLCWSGLKRAERLFLTLPITLMPGGRVEYHGAVAFGLSVFPVGNYDAAKKLELIERFEPAALFGTTSYFGHLAALSERRPVSDSMRVLLTGGEGAGFSWLERLEDAWGAKVFDRYGSTQAGTDHMFSCEHGIGTASRPGMLHNLDPFFLVEVVDPQTGRHVGDGEEGEIVVTSLYHTDTPLIRCRMRDRGVWRVPDYCPCGRPFTGLEVTTIARLDDMKKVKGVNIWPQAVDDALFSFGVVDEYRVLLTSDKSEADVATLQVMPKNDLDEEAQLSLRRDLSSLLRQRVGIHFAVEVVGQGMIERSEYKARRWKDERLHART